METVLQTGLSNALVASMLALVAVLVGYFYRRPALVHGLWLLVLLKLVTPPLVPIKIAWQVQADPEPTVASLTAEPSDIPVSPEFFVEPVSANEDLPPFVVQSDAPPGQSEPGAGAEPSSTVSPAPLPWQKIIAGVWLTGSISWFLLAGWRIWRFGGLLRFAVPAPEALHTMAERLARKMDLRRCPAVYLVPGRLAPMLWAIGGKPRLLIPRELLAHLTREQQETLLAHELAHLRRRDHWVRSLEFLAMGLYWWHPVVWYARRALREAEEQCCDAWVVSQLPGVGKTYALALLETLDFLSNARPATPLLASGIGQVSDLKRRLTMIMGASTPRALSWRGTLGVLTLGLFALPLLPTFTQAQTPDKPIEFRVQGFRVEPEKSPEGAKAQTELEKARVELIKLQLAMKATQDRIKALEAQLAAEKGGKGDDKPKEAVIVIRLNDGKQGVTEIHLRKVGDKWEVVQPPAKKPEVKVMEFELKDGNFWFAPAVPMGPNPPSGGFRIVPQPPQPPMFNPVVPATDNRIENLERQLKQIMGELESLRRDMKQPGKSPPAPGQTEENKRRLEEFKRSLPPGAKIEEKDGIHIITLPVEIVPARRSGHESGGGIEIEPKR